LVHSSFSARHFGFSTLLPFTLKKFSETGTQATPPFHVLTYFTAFSV
jgi:hypothetical protein